MHSLVDDTQKHGTCACATYTKYSACYVFGTSPFPAISPLSPSPDPVVSFESRGQRGQRKLAGRRRPFGVALVCVFAFYLLYEPAGPSVPGQKARLGRQQTAATVALVEVLKGRIFCAFACV